MVEPSIPNLTEHVPRRSSVSPAAPLSLSYVTNTLQEAALDSTVCKSLQSKSQSLILQWLPQLLILWSHIPNIARYHILEIYLTMILVIL